MNVFSNPIANENFLENVTVSENEKQNHVCFGDLLFTQSSETLEEVGYSSVWLGNGAPYLNSFCFGFRFFNLDCIDPLFIAHYFRSSTIRNAIMREGQGATRVNLSAKRLKNMVVRLPSITTQKQIGRMLHNIQLLVITTQQQLTNLTELKNGLLQQLFK